jgi:hypothetical protein
MPERSVSYDTRQGRGRRYLSFSNGHMATPPSITRTFWKPAEARIKAASVEIVLHGEAGSQQPHPFQRLPVDGLCGRIGDVEQGNGNAPLNRVGHLVHRVGAKEQDVRTAPFDLLSGGGKVLGRFIPFPQPL